MPYKLPANLKPVAIFTLCYLLVSALAAALTSNTEFVFYLLIMVVTIGSTLVIHEKVTFPRSIFWCLSIWGLLHMMGGMIPIPDSWQFHGRINVLYSFWLIPGYLKYDQLVHAYGFGIATWACWECLRSIVEKNTGEYMKASLGTLVLCLFAGMGLGALNEAIEFIATLMIPDTNVGDYENTGWDLVFNFIGGITAIAIIARKSTAK